MEKTLVRIGIGLAAAIITFDVVIVAMAVVINVTMHY